MNRSRWLRVFRVVAFALCGVALVLLLGFSWLWHGFQRSLPPLDGELNLPGLQAPATLSRDAHGVAVIEANTATDAFRALGFAHGQDRFFQMDLSRRRGAGELAALLGPMAVEADRSAKVHRFRDIGSQVFAQEPPERQALIRAYAEGVNAGLASLPAKPWEYSVLRTEPAPWTPVDTVLVLYAMAFDLQETAGLYELTIATLRDQLGVGAVNFFNPTVGPSDAALDGSTAPLPPPPPPRVINLRRPGATPAPERSSAQPLPPERQMTGSNALVVPGTRTAHGAAIVAGDPHLDLRLPNTWYRAQLSWTEASGERRQAAGATLPGVPGVIVGSNGFVAWSLTNSYADTGDLIALDLNPTAPELFYHRGPEMLEFERRLDQIEVKGGAPVAVETFWTVWGPVVGQTGRGKNLAYRWTLHDPNAANFGLLDLIGARNVEDAIAIAHSAGMPVHNIMLADRHGQAAWTIAGRLPRRYGYDGRFPVSWTYGDRGWDGYLASEEIPVVRPAPDGALWSGNQRKVGGEGLGRVGDAGYDLPFRAARLQQLLAEIPGPDVSPVDLLRVQLDTRGDWLARWQQRLLATLDDDAIAGSRARATFRRLVEETRELRAEPDHVGYRLMRAWHNELRSLTLDPIFARCRQAYPEFNSFYLKSEEALWVLHEEEPMHLLSPDYESWRELRLAAVDQAIARLLERAPSLERATWGERNRAAIRHPFSGTIPGLGDRLNLPAHPLPGDKNMPRVQSPTFGASLRFAVAPGQENEGWLHLPGGQSGHPLSPFYQAGHRAWVTGEPTPFLAGEILHTLRLQP
jgi:penicillin G amidase